MVLTFVNLWLAIVVHLHSSRGTLGFLLIFTEIAFIEKSQRPLPTMRYTVRRHGWKQHWGGLIRSSIWCLLSYSCYLVKLTVCFPSPGRHYRILGRGKRHVVPVPSYIAVCLYWAVYWLGMVQPRGVGPKASKPPYLGGFFCSTLLAFWNGDLTSLKSNGESCGCPCLYFWLSLMLWDDWGTAWIGRVVFNLTGSVASPSL
jgi:hypothetical protein